MDKEKLMKYFEYALHAVLMACLSTILGLIGTFLKDSTAVQGVLSAFGVPAALTPAIMMALGMIATYFSPTPQQQRLKRLALKKNQAAVVLPTAAKVEVPPVASVVLGACPYCLSPSVVLQVHFAHPPDQVEDKYAIACTHCFISTAPVRKDQADTMVKQWNAMKR